ncbi:hypothetical protein D3C73_527570 [compost metagenome]
MAVDFDRVPVNGLEAGDLVGRVRQRNGAVDGDRIVVPEEDELIELQVAGKRDGFVGDAFHQAAIAVDHVCIVILQVGAEFVAQLAFGNRHADGIGDALAERAGGGLDAGGVTVFRMTGGLGAELAKALQVLDGHVFITGQIQQRIKKHRTVAGRQHEAIAVRPVRFRRVELQIFGEQDRCHVGHAHRHARVAGIRLFDGIHGKETDRIRHPVVLFARSHG